VNGFDSREKLPSAPFLLAFGTVAVTVGIDAAPPHKRHTDEHSASRTLDDLVISVSFILEYWIVTSIENLGGELLTFRIPRRVFIIILLHSDFY
jgi:hypothetical protein